MIKCDRMHGMTIERQSNKYGSKKTNYNSFWIQSLTFDVIRQCFGQQIRF